MRIAVGVDGGRPGFSLQHGGKGRGVRYLRRPVLNYVSDGRISYEVDARKEAGFASSAFTLCLSRSNINFALTMHWEPS